MNKNVTGWKMWSCARVCVLCACRRYFHWACVCSVYMSKGAIVWEWIEKKGVCQRIGSSTIEGRLRCFFFPTGKSNNTWWLKLSVHYMASWTDWTATCHCAKTNSVLPISTSQWIPAFSYHSQKHNYTLYTLTATLLQLSFYLLVPYW